MRTICLAFAAMAILGTASAQSNPNDYNPSQDEFVPWKIIATGATFNGCAQEGVVRLRWHCPVSWKRVTSAYAGAASTTVLPAMWYVQSEQQIEKTQEYWYGAHTKGTIWYFDYSIQCQHPTVPPFISNSSPQASQSFLYDGVWPKLIPKDCTQGTGAGE